MAERRCRRSVISSRPPRGGPPAVRRSTTTGRRSGSRWASPPRRRHGPAAGFSSPGSEYDVSQETSPRKTSTWKRSSTAWRCSRASSRARRVWVMTSTRMWSSTAGRGYRWRRGSCRGESVARAPCLTYAHQGGAWEAPSSTLFALRRALELGVTGIELDVHATADRHLVVCHDGTVDRTTNGHGPIHAMTLAQVRALDNAYWFAPGGDETQGLAPDAYPYRGRAPTSPTSASPPSTRSSTSSTITPRWRSTSTSRQTAPAVEPYEERLARVLAGSPPGPIGSSWRRSSTSPPRRSPRCAPDVATSAGTLAVAVFWRAVNQGGESPASAHVALQVPAIYGELVVVDERFVERGARTGHGRPRVDHQRRGRDGPPARPGRRRDHLGPAHPPGGLWSGTRGLAYDPDRSRATGSAPTGVGPLAVVGLLLAADLALDGAFRHGGPR